ncbi:aminoglycoside phosphotransferase family protein [Fontimonas thermophila]|uniref:aminoglycoside phosphotransferase family protein n=1 Tax=Fontimonas thermophila TaxID=1076937 RepID=UPI000A897161|nr:phosphotransferase [Fontimonas thermophila]
MSDSILSCMDAADLRAQTARQWALAQLGLQQAEFAPASADASFRRYFRIRDGVRSWIVMDAPPEREPLAPFVTVAGLLHAAGLNAPRILAEDRMRGYLLLTDLGQQTFLQVLDEHNADALMSDAITALIRWQCSTRSGVLPPYDAALLKRELDLFPDWYVGRHLQRALSARQREVLTAIEHRLIGSALAQPRVFVHRDYMPRNLMFTDPNPGILDFQDAVEGPISYDVISLLRDAFLSWPEARVEHWLRQYWTAARAAGLPVDADFAAFRRACDFMGVQRHLKVIGIFARIHYRDGKPHYLADVPRFIGYVRGVAARYAELAPLLQLFDELNLHAEAT